MRGYCPSDYQRGDEFLPNSPWAIELPENVFFDDHQAVEFLMDVEEITQEQALIALDHIGGWDDGEYFYLTDDDEEYLDAIKRAKETA